MSIMPGTGCEKQLFDEEDASRMISDEDLETARRFFEAHKALFSAALCVRFRDFTNMTVKENRDNFGIYFGHVRSPVPFLWFGLGWDAADAPGTMPSWGASLEVNGAQVKPFMNNVGGLMSACTKAAGETETLKLHHFEQHVELAEWRSFDWLLPLINQRLALEQFWIRYLDILVAWGLAEATSSFIVQANL